LTSTVFRALK
jgi:hypothetical protein